MPIVIGRQHHPKRRDRWSALLWRNCVAATFLSVVIIFVSASRSPAQILLGPPPNSNNRTQEEEDNEQFLWCPDEEGTPLFSDTPGSPGLYQFYNRTADIPWM